MSLKLWVSLDAPKTSTSRSSTWTHHSLSRNPVVATCLVTAFADVGRWQQATTFPNARCRLYVTPHCPVETHHRIRLDQRFLPNSPLVWFHEVLWGRYTIPGSARIHTIGHGHTWLWNGTGRTYMPRPRSPVRRRRRRQNRRRSVLWRKHTTKTPTELAEGSTSPPQVRSPPFRIEDHHQSSVHNNTGIAFGMLAL